jgi:hypothetical protein
MPKVSTAAQISRSVLVKTSLGVRPWLVAGSPTPRPGGDDGDVSEDRSGIVEHRLKVRKPRRPIRESGSPLIKSDHSVGGG